MDKRLIFRSVLLLALVAVFSPARSVTAQSSPPYVYVFVDPASQSCGDLVNYTTGELEEGAPTPYTTLAPYEWLEVEAEQYGSASESLDVDHVIIVCYSFNPSGTSQTVEDDTLAQGSGGYRISFNIRGGVYPNDSNLFSVSTAYGGGTADCRDDTETHAGTYVPTLSSSNGYKFFTEVNVAEQFCSDPTYGRIRTRLRFYGDWPNEPTPTPTTTATPVPTNTPYATSTPNATATAALHRFDVCPSGFIYNDGDCVQPTCVDVTCNEDEICIDGQCVPEEDITERLDAEDCLNADAYLTDPEQWISSGEWSYGTISLGTGGYIRAFSDFSFPPGSYEYTIIARSVYAPGLSYPLYEDGDNPYDWYLEDDGQYHIWNQLVTYDSQTEIDNLGIKVDSNSYWELGYLKVDYICVEPYIVTPTPSPSPSPAATPTSTPLPGCANPDPNFITPQSWTYNAAYYSGNSIYLLHGGSAEIAGSIQPGLYSVRLGATSNNNGNVVTVSFADAVHELELYGDGALRDYSFYIQHTGATNSVMKFEAHPDNVSNIMIDEMCWSFVNGYTPTPEPDTPEPTQTPGGSTATATATAEATVTPTPGTGGDPGGEAVCINDDASIDDGHDYWQVSGSGSTISGGTAIIVPGGSLFESVNQDDPAKDYYVHIVAKTSSDAEMILNWRNNRQPFPVDGDSSYHQITLLVPRTTAQEMMAEPARQLIEPAERLNTQPFLSPLSVQQLHFVSPLQPPVNRLAASNILVIESPDINTANVEIESVCITEVYDDSSGKDWYDVDVFHPVCDTDYVMQEIYSDQTNSIRVGRGNRTGMPVHAILPGTVVMYGDWLSYEFGDIVYEGCAVIDHSAILNMTAQSVYCGLGEFVIPSSNYVKSGNMIGYVGEEDGLLTFAMQVQDDWVNPELYLEVFVDCHPYLLIFEPVARCGADNGNDLIPPRYNAEFPAGLNLIQEFLPWLAKRLYDVIGYPILCALVPLFNMVVSMMVNAANAIIASITPVMIFIYRVSKMFEYVITQLHNVLMSVVDIFVSMMDLQLCVRSILRYFTDALSTASDVDSAADIMFEDDTVLFGILAVSQLLINSRVATIILTPLSVLFIGFSAWKLIPWIMKNVRLMIGLGEG